MTAHQVGTSAFSGSPICADSADSIGPFFAHVPMHSETMAYQQLKPASPAKGPASPAKNKSILYKHLVWPFILKCAKSFLSHDNANDLEVRGYMHLFEHSAVSGIIQA